MTRGAAPAPPGKLKRLRTRIAELEQERDVLGDILEKSTVKELSASGHRFRRLFESNIMGMAISNQTRILDANDEFLRITGCTRDDLLKGEEAYKRHLGGKPVPLYRCRVRIR